jgi:hypothetical protein
MDLMSYPLLVFLVAFVVLSLAAWAGEFFGKRRSIETSEREDLGVILGAALTLLGLLIGFTFSMAISRYDQRKNLEEEEANAIGTEYSRVDLLPAADAAKTKDLLVRYLKQRVVYYRTRDESSLKEIDISTAKLQNDLWDAVRVPCGVRQTPVDHLILSGMNDVINSQGYTAAAWWNRIPQSAWALMLAIGVCCTTLFGYQTRYHRRNAMRLIMLPVIVAVAFFLIADLDSPRGGLVRIHPHNIEVVLDSVQPPK